MFHHNKVQRVRVEEGVNNMDIFLVTSNVQDKNHAFHILQEFGFYNLVSL